MNGLAIGTADFGAVVLVTDTKRHDPTKMPYALVRNVEKVFGGGYRASSAIFMDDPEKPTKFGIANLYEDEHGEIVARLPEKDACEIVYRAEGYPRVRH